MQFSLEILTCDAVTQHGTQGADLGLKPPAQPCFGFPHVFGFFRQALGWDHRPSNLESPTNRLLYQAKHTEGIMKRTRETDFQTLLH